VKQDRSATGPSSIRAGRIVAAWGTILLATILLVRSTRLDTGEPVDRKTSGSMSIGSSATRNDDTAVEVGMPGEPTAAPNVDRHEIRAKENLPGLRGRVVDVYGAPIGGAIVRHEIEEGNENASDEPFAVSAADGSFAIAPPSDAEPWIKLRIRATDFATVSRSFREFEVRARGDWLGRIELHRAASVHGRVIDEAGEPIEGATVHALDRDTRTVADAEGRYSFSGLDPGELELFVTAPGFTLPKMTSLHREHELPSIERRALTVLPGTVAEIDFVMIRGRHLEGRVVDEEGCPIAGARILAHATTHPDERRGNGCECRRLEVGAAVSDSAGRFVVTTVDESRAYVTGSHEGHDDATKVLTHDDDFVLVLRRRLEVFVRLLDPASGAPVESWFGVTWVELPQGVAPEAARPALNEPPEGTRSIRISQSGKDGQVLNLRAWSQEHSLIGSAMFSWPDPHRSIAVDLEGRRHALVFRVRDREGRPISGARIHREHQPNRQCFTDADGSAHLIAQEGEQGVAEVFEVAAVGFTTKRLPAIESVAEGGLEIDAILDPESVLEGRVLDARGHRGLDFVVLVVDSNGSVLMAKADEDGSYRITGAAPGRAEIRLAAASGSEDHLARSLLERSSVVTSVDLAPAAPTRLDIDPRVAGFEAIHGRARISGAPATRHQIHFRHRETEYEARIPIAPDGSFRSPPLVPGEYRVSLQVPNATYPLAVRDVILSEREGERFVAFDVMPVRLVARVVDAATGLPIPRGYVEIHSIEDQPEPRSLERGPRRLVDYDVRPDADGRFVLPAIEAGTWRAFVQPTDEAALTETRFRFVVPPVPVFEITFRVPRAGHLELRFAPPDPETDAPYCLFRLVSQDGGVYHFDASPDEHGVVELGPAPAGDYELIVHVASATERDEDGEPRWIEIHRVRVAIRPGGRTDVDLRHLPVEPGG
jgi:hypothetical protein